MDYKPFACDSDGIVQELKEKRPAKDNTGKKEIKYAVICFSVTVIIVALCTYFN